MIQLNGSVTTVEKMVVEVSEAELAKETQKNFSTLEILQMSYATWLRGKGMRSTDVKLRKSSSGVYYFEEYENNGSHYSGYFDRPNAYREGDEVIWEHFQALLNTLK